jgi:hypothetical protein
LGRLEKQDGLSHNCRNNAVTDGCYGIVTEVFMGVEQFTWSVEREGYEWRTLEARKSDFTNLGKVRVLMPRATGHERMANLYEPLKNPALWREFLNIERTEEGVLAFATRYGNLSDEDRVNVIVPMDSLDPKRPTSIGIAYSEQGKQPFQDKPDGFLDAGEILDTWLEKHLKPMQRAFFVWEAIRGEDKATLARHFVTDDSEGISWQFVLRPDQTYIPISAHKGMTKEEITKKSWSAWDWPEKFTLIDRLKGRGVDKVARAYVQKKINDGLTGRVSPRVMWDLRNVDTAHLDLMMVPHDLIGALWLQFAQAVTRETEFRQCVMCGDWFSLDGRNSQSREYCSNACKQRAYRERKPRVKTV